MLTPGQTLGNYHIVQEIGEGGMGTVYKAEQPAIKRVVVIKVLSANVADNPEMLVRFKRELDIIAQLEHPHILPVYDYGDHEGNPYLVMRFMGGGSLLEHVRGHTLGREEMLRVFDQIADALTYAHERNIIHRDLKPANVLLDERGNAYLADFGLARTLEGSSELTKTGSILGTPAYMSPEQARGERLDHLSDIYSLAIMAYEALAGQLPFSGKTTWDLIRQHLTTAPPSIISINPDLPYEVEELLNSALAKDKSERPATAVAFVQSLRAALAGATSSSFADTPTPTYPPTQAAIAAPTAAQSRMASVQGTRALPSVAPSVRAAPPPTTTTIPRSAAVAVPVVLGLVLLGGVALIAVLGLGAYFFRDTLFRPAIASYPVGDSPRSIMFDGASAWVVSGFDNTLTKLRATDCTPTAASCGEAIGTYPVDDLPVSVRDSDRNVWVASALNSKLTQIDRDSGAVLMKVNLPNVPSAMLTTEDSIWIANQFGNTVTKLDFSGNILADFPVPGGPVALAFTGNVIWVATPDNNEVIGLNPSDGTVVANVPLEGPPVALVAMQDYVWAAVADKNQVVAIEWQYGTVHSTLNVGQTPVALMSDGVHVWSANQGDSTLTRIDPESLSVLSTVKLSAKPYALAASFCPGICRDIWVVSESSDLVLRVRINN